MNRPGQPHLVVMLTCNDYTVENAEEIFEQSKNSRALYWGMKEEPLDPQRMQSLYAKMRESGKRTVLEVVGYTEAEALRGAELAEMCGCNYLMGTKFHQSVADFCRDHGIKYMPFVGTVEGRPSVLKGSVDEIIEEAKYAVSHGAYGIDLLGYRYVGDAVTLNREMTKALAPYPVCLAGSIDSIGRLDEVMESGAGSFTIGSAFFNNKFNGSFAEQINRVCDYLALRVAESRSCTVW